VTEAYNLIVLINHRIGGIMQKILNLDLEYNDTIMPNDIIRMLETIPDKEVNWAVDFSISRLKDLENERHQKT
jgi:hypothetical protein